MANQSIKMGLTDDNETVSMPVCSVIYRCNFADSSRKHCQLYSYTPNIEIDKYTHWLNAFNRRDCK